MKVTVQVVVQAGEDAEAPSVVREVLSVDREALAPDTLGLQRGEAMDLLSAVQGALVDEQGQGRTGYPGGLPGVWQAPAAQGLSHHRGAQPVRDPAVGQPAVVALWLPTTDEQTVQPLGRGAPDSGHAGASVPGSEVRRAGLGL